MNTDRENNHGEYWANEDGWFLSFDIKWILSWIGSKMKFLFSVLLLFLVPSVYGQTQYCGFDVGLVAKQTLSNLALYSQEFDNATWTKKDTTATANAILAPDGTLTADRLTSNSVNTTHAIYPTASMATITNGSSYRFSIYLKKYNYQYISFYYQGASNQGVVVDMNTGAITFASASVTSYSSSAARNGFYLISFTVVATNTVLYPTVTLAPTSGALSTSFLGTSTEAVDIWGVSVQLATAPADYILTTSSAASLAGVCGAGYAPSNLDPNSCFSLGLYPRRFENRTTDQITAGFE